MAAQFAATAAIGSFYPELQGALANQRALGVRNSTSSINPLYRRETWEGIDTARYDVTPGPLHPQYFRLCQRQNAVGLRL